jgi:hypothetical protein
MPRARTAATDFCVPVPPDGWGRRGPWINWQTTYTRSISPVSALVLGVAYHALAQPDERVFVPAGHGVGQLAQLDGEPVQIMA